MERFTANGLDLVDVDEIAQGIADKGFNCVRLPFSLEMYMSDPLVADDVLTANPRMLGMTAMEVFDETVAALSRAKVMTILNNHVSDAMWCCSPIDRQGAWFNKNYSTDDFVNVLAGLALRYSDDPYVIGNDLRNEVRLDLLNFIMPRWATGSERSDWKIVAERAGEAIHAQDPTQLIIIETVESGSNFIGIKEHPAVLSTPNKIVYSWHYYENYWSWRIANSQRGDYAEWKEQVDFHMNMITVEGEPYTAPLWLGEFGTKGTDTYYWQFLIRYLQENPHIHWGYWAYNGYKHTPADDYEKGILNNDMITVRNEQKLLDLQSIQELYTNYDVYNSSIPSGDSNFTQ
jgi:endoglucanase